MANRYRVVARTYLRWPLASALVVLFVPVYLAAAGAPNSVTDMLAYSYLALAFFGWGLSTHVKEQFANPRASLLPDFRRPHLAVAAALAVSVLVLMTVAMCYVKGTSLLGTVAVVLVLFTSALWWGYWPTWTWLPLGLLTLPLAFPPRHSLFTTLVEGQAVLVSVLIVLFCAALLKIFVARLMRLDEELPEYNVPLLTRLESPRQADVRRTWSTWGQRDTPLGPNPRPFNVQVLGRGDVQPGFFSRKVPADAGGSLWGRIRLWRVGMLNVRHPAGLVLMFPILLVISYLFGSGTRLAIRGSVEFPICFGFLYSVGVPILWVQSWPRLGYELLRPTTRRDFCRQMGLAIACELFEQWLWLLLFLGFVAAIWFPALLRTWDLAVYLALLACMWFGQWAATAWAVSYSRSLFLLIPVVMGISYVPYKMWQRYETSPMPFATEYYLKLALGMMLLWVVVLYLAYRRWQRLELT
jgi:hypothetical protein